MHRALDKHGKSPPSMARHMLSDHKFRGNRPISGTARIHEIQVPRGHSRFHIKLAFVRTCRSECGRARRTTKVQRCARDLSCLLYVHP